MSLDVHLLKSVTLCSPENITKHTFVYITYLVVNVTVL